MKLRKVNKKVHKWLSIPLGIILLIICLTGAILVFQKEILEISNPEWYAVKEVKGEAIPLDKLIPMVNSQLDNNTIANVEISKDPTSTYKMGLTEGFRASVFVDQYTGKITGEYSVREHPFFTVMSLHRWLLDSSHTWGKQIVGWSTFLFIFILITGLCYHSKKKKENYIIHFKNGTQRMMLGLHNTLGTYASIILIISALTGLMWSFDWYRNSVFYILGDRQQTEEKHEKGGRGKQGKGNKNNENTTIDYQIWQSVCNSVLDKDSNYDYIRISDGSVSAHPDDTYRTRVQDKIEFDKETGAINKISYFKDQDIKSKVWAWSYSLHVGDYWGLWSKILTFICCLIGASLPITGYYLAIKRWMKKNRKSKKHYQKA